ncbi:hypothetical protein [Cryptosporangium minutisporangium]
MSEAKPVVAVPTARVLPLRPMLPGRGPVRRGIRGAAAGDPARRAGWTGK